MLLEGRGHALEILAGAEVSRRRLVIAHRLDLLRAIAEFRALIEKRIAEVDVQQPRMRHRRVPGVEEFIDEIDRVLAEPRNDRAAQLDARAVKLAVTKAGD